MSTTSGVMRVEAFEGVTVARFQWPGNRASSALRIGTELDDFFESERNLPSKVVVLIAPPEVVDPANLELCDPLERDVDDRELMRRLVRRENASRRLVVGIREAEAFFVGVVHGVVAVRMAGPLLACDYRIASRGTTFEYAAQRSPVAPAGGVLWFLSRLVGPAKTVEMVLDGSPLDAAQAHRLGLVNFLTAADNVEPEALAEARRIAQLPRETLHQLKRAMVNSCECLSTYLDREGALLTREETSLLRARHGE